jgi:uncharacterized protein (DUF983 family)
MNRCPNCGSRTLFKRRTFFKLNAVCSACGLRFERDDGFFLGATWLNFGVTEICFLAPVLLLAYKNVISETGAVVLAGTVSVGIPAVIFRSSRSWWLLSYYFFLPRDLPANRNAAGAAGDQSF